MSSTNQYGLSRYIPLEIKRAVRQKCGFGCVVCGSAIYQYHHFDPPFNEAKQHNPNGITLLCGNCHDYLTKNIWSIDKLEKHNNDPKCLESGFSFGVFDIGSTPPVIKFGPNTFINTAETINVYGTPILMIEPPEVESSPLRMSGLFCDEEGKEIFKIEENEWKGYVSNWDIEITANSLTLRRDMGIIALKITSNPPQELIIEKINMNYRGVKLVGSIDSNFIIETPSGSQTLTEGNVITCAKYGIYIDQSGIIFGKF